MELIRRVDVHGTFYSLLAIDEALKNESTTFQVCKLGKETVLHSKLNIHSQVKCSDSSLLPQYSLCPYHFVGVTGVSIELAMNIS